jgi:hypothetical protein
MSIVVVGKSQALNPAAGVTANVGNINVRTNTFHVANPSTTVNAYVGVFNNYADAAAMDHPSVGNDAGGLIITPLQSIILTGNFGPDALSTQSNVYVSAITAVGSTSVFFTPVAPGSTL